MREDVEDIFPERPPDDLLRGGRARLPLGRQAAPHGQGGGGLSGGHAPGGAESAVGESQETGQAGCPGGGYGGDQRLPLSAPHDPRGPERDEHPITLGDLHVMIGWLTHCKLVLSDIYCPPAKPCHIHWDSSGVSCK